MSEQECTRELAAEVEQLRVRLREQEGLLSRRERWEGDELYEQLRELEAVRGQRQAEYKRLMRDHFKFAKLGALERQGDSFLEEKLKKMLTNAGHDIDHLLSAANSKSSISSSSSHSSLEYSDWLDQDKQLHHHQLQAKVLQEIGELEKILESME